jgi:hypothetical protein
MKCKHINNNENYAQMRLNIKFKKKKILKHLILRIKDLFLN